MFQHFDLHGLDLKRENYATRPGLSQLSRAKVNGMERLDGPHGKKDVRPRDSQGILAKLADSNLAKTIRAGTAVAMLYGATPATEAEAAPKQRPVAAHTLKAKPGKAPESAKKASPAEQMRVRRQATEREAAPRAGITQSIAAPQMEAEKEFAQILHEIQKDKKSADSTMSAEDFLFALRDKKYEPGSANVRSVIDSFLGFQKGKWRHKGETLANDDFKYPTFHRENYAQLERYYGDEYTFGKKFFESSPELFIEHVLNNEEFQQQPLARDIATMAPTLTRVVLDDPVHYLRGGYYSGQYKLMARVLDAVLPHIDDAAKKQLSGKLKDAFPNVGIQAIANLPPSVFTFAFDSADVEALRLDLARQSFTAGGTFKERGANYNDYLNMLTNDVRNVEPARKLFFDQASVAFTGAMFGELGPLMRGLRVPSILQEMLSGALRTEPRMYFDRERSSFNRERIRRELNQLQGQVGLGHLPTENEVFSTLRNLDYFLGTKQYEGREDIFVTGYVNFVAKNIESGSDASLLGYETARLINPVYAEREVKMRPDLLDSAAIKSAIEKTPARARRTFFHLIEKFTTDEAYLARSIQELVVGNDQKSAVDMLGAYTELWRSTSKDMIMQAKIPEILTGVFQGDATRLDALKLRSTPISTVNAIDEDIRREITANGILSDILKLIEEKVIVAYDLQEGGRGTFAESLHSGFEHLYPAMVAALPAWKDVLKDNPYRIKGTAEHLLKSGYPILEIQSLLERGFPKNAETGWELFGRAYATNRSPTIDRPWQDVPLAESIHLHTDHLLSKYESLRSLDISKPDVYIQLFSFFRGAGTTELERSMIGTLDYYAFDTMVNERMAAKELPRLFKDMRSFANMVDPTFMTTLVNRVMVQNGEAVQLYLRNNNIPDKDGTLHVRSANIDAIALYLDIDETPGINPDYKRTEQPRHVDISDLNIERASIEELVQIYGIAGRMQRIFEYDHPDDEGRKLAKMQQNLIKRIVPLMTSGALGSQVPDPVLVERFRQDVNAAERGAGNELLMTVAERFLEQSRNVDSLLDFGRSWANFGQASRDRDVGDIFKLVSGFAFNQAYVEARKTPGALTPERVSIFERYGIAASPDQSTASKVVSRTLSGQIGTVFQRGLSRATLRPESIVGHVAKASFEKPMRANARAEYLCADSENCTKTNAEALLVTVEPTHSRIRLATGRSGVVDTERVEREMGENFVFSAPVSFTTGARMVMDVAFSEGQAIGSYIKADGRDGIIVTNQEGAAVVVNKRNLRLGDLGSLGVPIPPEIAETRIDITRSLGEYKRFFDLMQTNKLSALTNMLLVENGQLQPTVDDRNDSRRMFVTFDNGAMGVINSLKNMPTNRLAGIAVAAGAREAVYMDTGMYDDARLRAADGSRTVVGHADSARSTNRLFLGTR